MRFIKLLSLAIAISSIAITGCKDDNEVNVSEAGIEGTWNLDEVYMNNGKISISDGTGPSIDGDFTFETTESTTTVTFETNPNIYTSEGSITYEATTMVLGQSETESLTAEGLLGLGEWELVGDIMTQYPVSDVQFPTDMKVEELTDSRMKLRMDLDETVAELGLSVRNTGTIYAILTR